MYSVCLCLCVCGVIFLSISANKNGIDLVEANWFFDIEKWMRLIKNQEKLWNILVWYSALLNKNIKRNFQNVKNR